MEEIQNTKEKAINLLVVLCENFESIQLKEETKKIFNDNKEKMGPIIKFAASVLEQEKLVHCLQTIKGQQKISNLAIKGFLLKILSEEATSRFWPLIQKIIVEINSEPIENPNDPQEESKQRIKRIREKIDNLIEGLTEEEIVAIQSSIKRPNEIEHAMMTHINITLEKYRYFKENNINPKQKADKDQVIY